MEKWNDKQWRIQLSNTPIRERAIERIIKKYNNGEDAMNVAYAIVTGLLDREKMPVELLEEIEGALSFFLSMKERGELKEPGEE